MIGLGASCGGWYVDAAGGLLAVDVDNADRVHVHTARNDMHYVFDTNGSLLQKEKTTGDYKRAGREQRDGAGNTYIVRHPSIWPQVVKIAPSGRERALISPRILLWLVSGPFPAWIFCAVGIIGLNVGQKLRRKTRADTSEGAAPEEHPDGSAVM